MGCHGLARDDGLQSSREALVLDADGQIISQSSAGDVGSNPESELQLTGIHLD